MNDAYRDRSMRVSSCQGMAGAGSCTRNPSASRARNQGVAAPEWSRSTQTSYSRFSLESILWLVSAGSSVPLRRPAARKTDLCQRAAWMSGGFSTTPRPPAVRPRVPARLAIKPIHLARRGRWSAQFRCGQCQPPSQAHSYSSILATISSGFRDRLSQP
jgi:hypothetical protein